MRWTPRARRLGWVIAVLLGCLALYCSALVGLHRQDRWRCEHGVVEAC